MPPIPLGTRDEVHQRGAGCVLTGAAVSAESQALQEPSPGAGAAGAARLFEHAGGEQ